MPLPKPKDDENQDEWIERCMSNDAMKEEFPDNDQRLAVCFQKWRDKDKKSTDIDELRGVLERRYVTDMELRLSDEEESNTIIGYAAVFNSWSEDLGFFKEQIAPGAFKRTIKNGDVRALINHNPDLVIGRTKNKTLRLSEDDKGLAFEVDLPDTSYALDLRESIRRKDITQNSFGFQTIKDEWSEDGKRRTLKEVKLFDVSPVTFPAYKQTTVKMRLLEMGIDYEALNVALVRASRGIMINSDVDLVESTIKILRRYLPNAIVDPPAEIASDPGHSTPEADPDLVSTLIRVRMAEMQIRQNLSRR